MRITRYILLAAPLLLCGCDTAELIGRPAPDLDRNYSVTAEIDYGSSSAVAATQKMSPKSCMQPRLTSLMNCSWAMPWYSAWV